MAEKAKSTKQPTKLKKVGRPPKFKQSSAKPSVRELANSGVIEGLAELVNVGSDLYDQNDTIIELLEEIRDELRKPRGLARLFRSRKDIE